MKALHKSGAIFWTSIVALGALSQDVLARNGDFPPYWGWHPMWGFGGIFMMILMFLFWAAVIVGIVLFIRWLWAGKLPESLKGETALDILKKRYARGEIERQEFEEKKKLLE